MSSATETESTVRPRKSMPPGRPKSSNPITRFIGWIWKYEVLMEGTLSLGMMELWEKLLCLFVVVTLSSLVWWSFYFHFPNHIRSVVARSTYYIFGTQPSSMKEAATQVIASANISAANVIAHGEL